VLLRIQPPGEPSLDPNELPADRPVATADRAAMAVGLEAIVSLPPLPPSVQSELLKRVEQARQALIRPRKPKGE
jgi:hypothetical protein